MFHRQNVMGERRTARIFFGLTAHWTFVPQSERPRSNALRSEGFATNVAGCRYPDSNRRSESRGGITPPRAPRNVREPLRSYGSQCPALAIQKRPMSKQVRR